MNTTNIYLGEGLAFMQPYERKTIISSQILPAKFSEAYYI